VGEWEESRLGEVAKFIDSLHETPKQYVETGYPMIRVADVKDSGLNLDSCLKVRDFQRIKYTGNQNDNHYEGEGRGSRRLPLPSPFVVNSIMIRFWVVRDVNTINRYTEDVVEGNSRTIKRCGKA
jgi:hypothetical protein